MSHDRRAEATQLLGLSWLLTRIVLEEGLVGIAIVQRPARVEGPGVSPPPPRRVGRVAVKYLGEAIPGALALHVPVRADRVVEHRQSETRPSPGRGVAEDVVAQVGQVEAGRRDVRRHDEVPLLGEGRDALPPVGVRDDVAHGVDVRRQVEGDFVVLFDG